MNFKYAFNLGRVFTLSLAELFSVFEIIGLKFRLVDLYREVLVIEVEKPLSFEPLQKRLGGTIKIMAILDVLGRKKNAMPSMVFREYFDTKRLKNQFGVSFQGKTQLGISLYPMTDKLFLRGEAKRLGLGLKAQLVKDQNSIRMVLPQEPGIALPSVVVAHENLLQKGAELDFLVGADKIYVGKTLAIQDFEDYGRRDYQRPVRDTRVGLLPPKVAQVMINLAHPAPGALNNLKTAILDPFVGSGTVLQEAMIMGYKAVGADVSAKAVENAEKNLLWIKNRYRLPTGRYELLESDIKDLPKNLPRLTYEAIVTEGTLGPAYNEIPSEKEMEKNFKSLEKVYLSAFKSFKKILNPGKRVVIALPAYRLKTGYKLFPVVDKIAKLGYDVINPVPEVMIEKFSFLQITPRKSIIYDRKDQFVSREIFIFKLAT